MTTLAIDIHKITKAFHQKVVVDHVSLQVKKGTIFGFLGANGSGKTTMIRMICGLLTPTAGTGHCLGYDITTQSAEIKRKVGYMPQKFSLYAGLTVYESLRFFAEIYQIPNATQSIQNILKELDLIPYQHLQVGYLSGGWKQRLTLACCVLHQPELLFLDEPTAGVDPKARKDFWNYLHQISIERGTTVLVTTHYMDEAEKCTDLAYIHLGKLLYTGTTKALLPFSKVKTYVIAADRNSVASLSALVQSKYPELLVAVVNNDLRVSSAHHTVLEKFMHSQKKYTFQEVEPTFEEVFIGLMQ